ncbi:MULTISPECIES: hypothetical protein [unclassified Acinetobacter]|uniref:hypothetical protein n=1 Tax=unclassified Acinetobacter TaxID=196816 RepID=UPI0015D20F41|nr:MULTISPECIES: hypothetical protein [unclassified Acinetobacter]
MIKYILTTYSFFKEGPCGRVSHAKGFVEGLSQNDNPVTIVSYGGGEKFIKINLSINFSIVGCFFNFFKEILISIFFKRKNSD